MSEAVTEPVSCAHCGESFTPAVAGQVYCSTAHKKAARQRRQRAYAREGPVIVPEQVAPEPGVRADFAGVQKILSEQFHGWNTAPARRWYQGNRAPQSRRRDGRGLVLAEARALMPVRPAALPADGTRGRLLALMDRLSVLYSFERCPDCSHPGWAHGGHCTRLCDCLMRLPGRARQ